MTEAELKKKFINLKNWNFKVKQTLNEKKTINNNRGLFLKNKN